MYHVRNVKLYSESAELATTCAAVWLVSSQVNLRWLALSFVQRLYTVSLPRGKFQPTLAFPMDSEDSRFSIACQWLNEIRQLYEFEINGEFSLWYNWSRESSAIHFLLAFIFLFIRKK